MMSFAGESLVALLVMSAGVVVDVMSVDTGVALSVFGSEVDMTQIKSKELLQFNGFIDNKYHDENL
jgi:hypothetical protein